MKKTYEEINNIIEKAIEEKRNELDTLYANKKANQNTIAKCNADMVAATTENNTKKYKDAKKNREDAACNIELISARIEKIEKEAYVSDEEAIKLKEQINMIQKNRLNELNENLARLLVEIKNVSSEAFADIEEGNELLAKWHNDVKPFKNVLGYRETEPIYTNEVPSFSEARPIGLYISSITSNPSFEAITGIKVEQKKATRFVI